jgi:hypothetical protein
VNRPFQRRLVGFFVAVAAGCGVLNFVPGSALDRHAFTAVAQGFTNPPFFVSGEGSHAAPWQLRAPTTTTRPAPQLAPAIVSLADDPDGFFQSSPPAPIDMAVIFSNFHRLGVKDAGVACVLAWEAADAIGLAALEKSLARFDSLTLAAPLSRSAVPTPILPSFRRASLPLTAIHGDTKQLPTVNRCPIPDLILGGENARAGFSVLESEPTGNSPYLLARWEDRVIFSYPLLAVLQRLKLTPEAVEVRLGESLKLSPAGPVLPIDTYGRIVASIKPTPAHTEISAEALVNAAVGAIPENAPRPVILRDDRSAADAGTRDFSNNLSAVIQAIASEAGLGETQKFRRASLAWELGMLGAVAAILSLLSGSSSFVRNLGTLILGAACLAAQWIGLGMASAWLPGIALLAAILATSAIANLVGNSPSPTPTPLPPQQKPTLAHATPPPAAPETQINRKPPAQKSTAQKRSRSKKSSSKS